MNIFKKYENVIHYIMIIDLKNKQMIILLLFCVIVLVFFFVTSIIPYFTTGQGYGRLTVSEVNESKAIAGIIVHINETDLKVLPILTRMLQENRLGSVDLNPKEFGICNDKFGWYQSMDKFRYIEYKGRFYSVNCYRV